MASLPAYANNDLISTALLLGGFDPGQLQTELQRNNGNASAVLDALSASNDDHTRRLASLAKGYISNPGTGHLTDLMTFAGVDSNMIAQAINNVQGDNPDQKAPTPQVQSVLASLKQIGGDPTGFVDRVNNGLQQAGLGTSALTTTREQYLFPKQNPPAPAPGVQQPAAAPAPGGQPAPTGPPGPGSFAPAPGPSPSVQSGIAPYRSDIKLTPQQLGQTPGPLPGAGAGGTGGTGAGSIAIPPPTSPDDLITYIKQNAGAFAWFDDIPEIHNIIVNVAGQPGDLSAKLGQFENQITQTSWWRNTTAQARTAHAQMRSDPGTWGSTVAQTAGAIGKLAANEGVNISPDRLQDIANAATTYGWTSDQINSAVAAEYHYDPTNRQQGATATSVKSLASKYLVPMSDQAMQTWTQQLMSGQTTIDNFQRYLGAQAKSMMPWLSESIDQNMDPQQALDPYRQKIASTLEIDPNTIDWTDPKWNGLIQKTDPKTGQSVAPNYGDVIRAVQTDPKYGWDHTQNALQTASDMGAQLLKNFGVS